MTRYPVSLGAVLATVAALAAVFVFARPQLESEPGTEMVNLAEKAYHYLGGSISWALFLVG